MLKLKFAIYHKAASLSPYGWRIIGQALFKHWVNNGCQRLSVSSCTQPYFQFNNLLFCCYVICLHASVFENGAANEAIVLQW